MSVDLSTVEDDTKPRTIAVNIPVLMTMCRLTVEAFDSVFNQRMQLAGHATGEQEPGNSTGLLAPAWRESRRRFPTKDVLLDQPPKSVLAEIESRGCRQ